MIEDYLSLLMSIIEDYLLLLMTIDAWLSVMIDYKWLLIIFEGYWLLLVNLDAWCLMIGVCIHLIGIRGHSAWSIKNQSAASDSVADRIVPVTVVKDSNTTLW